MTSAAGGHLRILEYRGSIGACVSHQHQAGENLSGPRQLQQCEMCWCSGVRMLSSTLLHVCDHGHDMSMRSELRRYRVSGPVSLTKIKLVRTCWPRALQQCDICWCPDVWMLSSTLRVCDSILSDTPSYSTVRVCYSILYDT